MQFIVSAMCLGIFFWPVVGVLGYCGLDRLALATLGVWVVLSVWLAHAAETAS